MQLRPLRKEGVEHLHGLVDLPVLLVGLGKRHGPRELHLKRSFMRHQGKLYVYTSSVPESAVSEASVSQDDIVEDVDRVAVVFNLLVLWRN